MEALFIAADSLEDGELNSSYYRCLIPAKYLSKVGHDIRICSGVSVTSQNLGITDPIDYTWIPETVLIERTLTPERITKLREAGARRIIATFDDHYGIIPPNFSSYTYWHKHGGYPAFIKALGMVDLAIVPNQALADVYSKWCKDILYVPNFIDPDDYSGVARVKTGPKVIGWGGSRGHVESWRGTRLAEHLRVVQDKLGDQIKIVIYDDRVSSPFLDAAGVEYEHHFPVPIREWPRHLAQFDIGLAPLFGEYDTYRSNLKLVEYGALGIPFVASPFGPYLGTSAYGGMFATGNDWIWCLRDLVEGNGITVAGKAYAMKYQMDQHISDYENILWGPA